MTFQVGNAIFAGYYKFECLYFGYNFYKFWNVVQIDAETIRSMHQIRKKSTLIEIRIEQNRPNPQSIAVQ